MEMLPFTSFWRYLNRNFNEGSFHTFLVYMITSNEGKQHSTAQHGISSVSRFSLQFDTLLIKHQKRAWFGRKHHLRCVNQSHLHWHYDVWYGANNISESLLTSYFKIHFFLKAKFLFAKIQGLLTWGELNELEWKRISSRSLKSSLLQHFHKKYCSAS